MSLVSFSINLRNAINSDSLLTFKLPSSEEPPIVDGGAVIEASRSGLESGHPDHIQIRARVIEASRLGMKTVYCFLTNAVNR